MVCNYHIYFKSNITMLHMFYEKLFKILLYDSFIFCRFFWRGKTFSMFHYIMSLYSPSLFTSCVIIHEEMILQTWSYAYVKLTIKKEMTYSTKNTLSSPAATNIHSLMIMFFEGWPNKRLEIITNNSWKWFFKTWHYMTFNVISVIVFAKSVWLNS